MLAASRPENSRAALMQQQRPSCAHEMQVSSAKRARSRGLLQRSAQRGATASDPEAAAAEAGEAADGALEDSEVPRGNACINLLDGSEDEDTSRPQPVRPSHLPQEMTYSH